MKTAIYARVSTDEQVRSGYSLAEQSRAGREYFHSLGIPDEEIEEFIDEGYSGEFLDRPALTSLRDKVYAKMIDHVWVLDPDRLSRDDVHAYMLKEEIEKNAKLYFHTGNYDKSPEGKLFFKIRASVAAFEKDKIRERTMRGKRGKALQGKIVARRDRFGYDWDPEKSNYVINEREADMVRWVYDLCINGLGLHQITAKIKEAGVKTKRGGPFYFTLVHRILTDEFYTGTCTFFRERWMKTSHTEYRVAAVDRDKWISVPVPPIVTPEIQHRAKIALASNKKYSSRNTKKREYLLTGLLKCKICGAGMAAFPHSNGISYYVCYNKRVNKSCPKSGWIPAETIDAAVWNRMLELAHDRLDLLSLLKDNQKDYSKEIAALTAKEEEFKKRRVEIAVLISEGLLSVEDAEEGLTRINKELNQLSAELSSLQAVQANKHQLIISPADIINAQTIKSKNKIIRDLGITVFAHRPKRGSTGSRSLILEYDF